MNIFKSTEWTSHDKEFKLELPWKSDVKLSAISAETITLSAVTDTGEIVPLRHGNEIQLRATMHGFSELYLKSKGTIGLKINVRSKQLDEPRNDELPTLRPQSNNLLQKLRREAQQSFGVMREEFANEETDLPGYEMPDGVGDVFEEDEEEIRRQLNEENDDTETPDTGGDPDPDDPAPEPPTGT